MLNTYKELVVSQYEAALSTVNACIAGCPEASWNAPVARYPFCQVAFHTLFYADVYLGRGLGSLRDQPFHRDNASSFGDYEQLEDREPVSLYERPFNKAYMQHCREKVASVIAAETADTLRGPCGFEWRDFTRAELHLYNIRHIQHHAAQLILRLRLDTDVDIPWFGSGWKDV